MSHEHSRIQQALLLSKTLEGPVTARNSSNPHVFPEPDTGTVLLSFFCGYYRTHIRQVVQFGQRDTSTINRNHDDDEGETNSAIKYNNQKQSKITIFFRVLWFFVFGIVRWWQTRKKENNAKKPMR